MYNGGLEKVPDGQPQWTGSTQVSADHCLVWAAYKNNLSPVAVIKASPLQLGPPLHHQQTWPAMASFFNYGLWAVCARESMVASVALSWATVDCS